GKYLPGIAVHRLQSDYVLAAEAGDGAGQHGLAVAAHANLSRHFLSEPLPGSASHQIQGLAHPLVRQQVEERGLGKLHGETLLEERCCGTRAEIETTGHQTHDDKYGSGNQNLRGFPSSSYRNLSDLRLTR